jgi:hypothetical protein
VRLSRAGHGTLQATLDGDLSGCRATRTRGPHSRRLRVQTAGGLRTRGRFATATAAGNGQTEWLTEDTCTGTLVRAIERTVTIHDLIADRTIHLVAGRSYTARRHVASR